LKRRSGLDRMGEPRTFRTNSPAATIAVGRRLAGQLRRGDCVALTGQLGAGKTILVKGLAAGLGVADETIVASPTFVLVREYPGRLPIYHVDLYRLPSDEADLSSLGIDEMLTDGVVIVEWADKAGASLPRRRWQVEIAITGPRSRLISVRRIG